MNALYCPACLIVLDGQRCPRCDFALTPEQVELIQKSPSPSYQQLELPFKEKENVQTLYTTGVTSWSTSSMWASNVVMTQQWGPVSTEVAPEGTYNALDRSEYPFWQSTGKKKKEPKTVLDPGKPRKITLNQE